MVWGLGTELQEAWLKDSPTSNGHFLSNPAPPPPSSRQLQLYQVASKSYSLKPSSKLLPQLAGSPPFGVLAMPCQHILFQKLAFLFLRQLSRLQSFHIRNPRTEKQGRKAKSLTNSPERGYLCEDRQKVDAGH